MTSLLVVTFVGGGLHTLLWLPRAFQMRREMRALEAEDRRKEAEAEERGEEEEQP